MRKLWNYTPLLVIVIVLGLLVFSSQAHAQPPSQGELAQFSVPVIICDEESQVRDITTKARETEGKGFYETYLSYYRQANVAGESVCMVGMMPPAIVVEVKPIGDTYTDQGIHSNAWAINLVNPMGNVWIIYIERIQEISL